MVGWHIFTHNKKNYSTLKLKVEYKKFKIKFKKKNKIKCRLTHVDKTQASNLEPQTHIDEPPTHVDVLQVSNVEAVTAKKSLINYFFHAIL